jgi:hypothetical protein
MHKAFKLTFSLVLFVAGVIGGSQDEHALVASIIIKDMDVFMTKVSDFEKKLLTVSYSATPAVAKVQLLAAYSDLASHIYTQLSTVTEMSTHTSDRISKALESIQTVLTEDRWKPINKHP